MGPLLLDDIEGLMKEFKTRIDRSSILTVVFAVLVEGIRGTHRRYLVGFQRVVLNLC